MKGSFSLDGTDGNMDSKYYFQVLEEALIPQAEEALGGIWTLVYDGERVNRADYTKD